MTHTYNAAALSYSIHVNIAEIMNIITIVFPSLLEFFAALMQNIPNSICNLSVPSPTMFLTPLVLVSISVYAIQSTLTPTIDSHLHLFVLYKIMSPTYKVNVPPHSTYKAHVFF
jgi:hypothetical protein